MSWFRKMFPQSYGFRTTRPPTSGCASHGCCGWCGARGGGDCLIPPKAGWVSKLKPPPEPHWCRPPKDKKPRVVGRLDFDQPPLDADVGSIWQCDCGQQWEIYLAPHAIGSGSVWHEREWRRVKEAQESELLPQT